MKIFLFSILILSISLNSFSQALNVERTKQLAALEKSKFDAHNSKPSSLASNNFDVYYYRCKWNIDPAVRYISGSVTSYIKIIAATNQITYDFTNKLTVDSIIFRNQPITFSQQTNATLVINLAASLSKGKKDSLIIYYHGVPPGSGDFTGGFTQTTHSGKPVIWTLSEPYGASGWWPCRNGLDDKADSIDIYITHPSQYKASSNGVLVSTTTNGNSTISYYKHRYPIASYLVAFAVTNYTTFTDNVLIGAKTLPVIQYIYPESVASFQSATSTVLGALQLYSSNFGAYPFLNERYGQTQFGWGGGMEHQTNSFVTGTGTGLLTHELGHQWFGDKITCGSWQDIWLNEGFATWLADMFYTENTDTSLNRAYVESDLSYIISQPGGSVWVDDTTNSGRIFDGRLSYSKGAFLLRMLRWTLGDSAFFAGINKYITDPKLAYGFARTADLQRNLEKASGKSLGYFFQQWFYGQGYPSFTVKWKDSSDHKLYFTVTQKTSMPSSVPFFKVPLPVRVSNGTKSKIIILQCTQKTQSFIKDEPDFFVTKVEVDPDKYLISSDNKSVKNKNLDAFDAPQQTAKIKVSPNPVFNEAIVSFENLQGKMKLQLFNSTGTILWNGNAEVTGISFKTFIPFSSFKNGIYVLMITEENGSQHSVTIIK